MYTRGSAKTPDALLVPLNRRPGGCVYFLRLDAWSPALEDVLARCRDAALGNGVVLETGVANPGESVVDRYREVFGDAWAEDAGAIAEALARWVPGLNAPQREELARGIAALLDEQKAARKPDGARKNLYIKLMSWLYDRFRFLADSLGIDPLPLIVCVAEEGLSAHALLLLRLLSGVGADVLLIEPRGDAAYRALDPEDRWSERCAVPAGTPFPADFSLKALRARPVPPPAPTKPAAPPPASPVPHLTIPGASAPAAPKPEERAPTLHIRVGGKAEEPEKSPGPPRPERKKHPEEAEILLRFRPPQRPLCVNAWIGEPGLGAVRTPYRKRSEDPNLCCTALIRMAGVRDKLTYAADLYTLYQDLQAAGRTVLIADGTPGEPSPADVAAIRRRPKYRTCTELIVDLALNLPPMGSQELQRYAQAAFARAVMEEDLRLNDLNALRNEAVVLLASVRTLIPKLWGAWRETDVPVYILMGRCRGERDALLLRWLSMMPADLLILAPDRDRPCAFSAPDLLELTGEASLPEFPFPRDRSQLTMRTVASHAEGELTDLLYQGGIYRSHQFTRADTVVLQSTADEIGLYWKEELNLRPGFSTGNGAAHIPVIWARINGVNTKDELTYWQRVASLLGEGTLLVRGFPSVDPLRARQYAALAQKHLRQGRIDREGLTADRLYPYGMLRPEIQAHILDKAQLMLDQRLIRGTYENGAEYAVLSGALSLPETVCEMVQSFDFARRSPKVVCVHCGRSEASLDDAIQLTFLSLLGFDVLIFAPTGYQAFERWLNDRFPVVHEAGGYRFDFTVPDFATLPKPKKGLLSRMRGWLGGE